MTGFGLFLDLLLIVLLGTMITFVLKLYRRLEVLRSGKQDLEGLLRELVASTATAERNLRDLQSSAEELAPTLQRHVAGARAAREELEFLLGSADATAERLLAQIASAKQEAGRPRMAEPEPADTPIAPPPLRAVRTTTAPVAAAQPAASAEDARRVAEAELLRAIEKLR